MTHGLYVTWRSGGDTTGQWGTVGRLERISTGYRFYYTRGAKLLQGFYPFNGMDDLGAVYESDELFPLFANRLLGPSRPEYRDYLEWSGFDPDNPPDPIALLGVTQGRRATDQIEVFPDPQPDTDGCFQTKFFLHGLRFSNREAQERIAKLLPRERLGLLPDCHNLVDSVAVAVRTLDVSQNYLLGYVPRYLAADVRKLLQASSPDSTQLQVERYNPDAPIQFRLLCRFQTFWPTGFVPFQSDAFQPLVQLQEATL